MTPPCNLYGVNVVFDLHCSGRIPNLISCFGYDLLIPENDSPPFNAPLMTGITSYLPPSIRKIRNKEGVHGAISFIFRSPFSAEKFPSGRALSGNYVTIREALERRRKIHLIRKPDRTVFRVGQVVVHKASQCRCVVIGSYCQSHVYTGKSYLPTRK